MDINSTNFSKSNTSANIAEQNPDMTRFSNGTWVRALIFSKHENNNPSDAIAYRHLGRANKEPSNVVDMPHNAPMEIAYFAHGSHFLLQKIIGV